jgi:hypothetical protein
VCHQTVGLVQSELEGVGIATASITLLPAITRKVNVPRALAVPFPLGFPLGSAGDPQLQREVLKALLALAPRADLPVLETYDASSPDAPGGDDTQPTG